MLLLNAIVVAEVVIVYTPRRPTIIVVSAYPQTAASTAGIFTIRNALLELASHRRLLGAELVSRLLLLLESIFGLLDLELVPTIVVDIDVVRR